MASKSKFLVRDGDLNANSEVKLSSYMKYMQDVARCDLTKDGASYEVMRSEGMVFVQIKFAMDILESAEFGEELEAETWAKCIRGATFIRDYRITSKGKTVARASTTWVLVNFETRKIIRPAAYKHPCDSFPEKSEGMEEPGKISAPEHVFPVAVRQVRFSDLDHNLHLNNTVYMDIINDCLEAPCEYNINKVQINYISECRQGEELHIYRADCGDGRVYFRGDNVTKDKVSFEAVVSLSEKPSK